MDVVHRFYHSEVDIEIQPGRINTFLPLCTYCIAVSCSSPAPFLAYLTEGVRHGLVEQSCVFSGLVLNDSRVSVMYGRAARTSITVVSKFPTKKNERLKG